MRLAQLGYDVAGPNRDFDAVSARSLRTYQAAHGLYADGIAGSVTLSLLGIWKPPPVTIVRSGGSITAVGRRQVALTFDDGPSSYTSQVLDVLRRYDVPATFFVQGGLVAANADAVKRAVREGHSVQSHTWGHPVLARLSDSAISAELSRASAAIKASTGRWPTCYRPPEGVTSDRVRAVARSVGLGDEVLWNVDPSDYRRPPPSTLASRVLAAANGQGVLPVLHDGGGNRANTVAALPTIIETLNARGYRFVRLCD